MQVILVLDPAKSAKRLAALSRKLGAPIQPLHPGTTDPALGRYFAAELSDSDAEGAAERMRAEPGVEAAYAKPLDSAPFL